MERDDEIARLLVLNMSANYETQGALCVALSNAGFGTKRISELTGIKPNTVQVSITRERARRKKVK